MNAKNAGWLCGALLALAIGSMGCRTVATAGRSAGEAAGDTAEAAGHAAGTAVRGAGDIINDTAKSADDEIR
jgi:hypothetical protein